MRQLRQRTGEISARMPAPLPLQDRVAVVTGATRGLGAAIARAYVRAGARVAVASLPAEPIDRIVAALNVDGTSALGIACDVRERCQVEAAAEQVLTTFGHLDVWVNNAAVAAPYGPTARVPLDAFEQVVRTNVLGTYYGSVVAMREFVRQGRGKLINVVGRGDRQLVANQNAYTSSKAWIRHFTLTLAAEHRASAPAIGVYTFNPGLMPTDLVRHVTVVDGYERALQGLPSVVALFGRPPERVAEKAVWLASSATDRRTGLQVSPHTRADAAAGLLYGLARRVVGRLVVPELNVSIVAPSDFPDMPPRQAAGTNRSSR
jgi:NAD(P)-dependent dehydrogenase (short-subunit alcohol dehydrogenase family)